MVIDLTSLNPERNPEVEQWMTKAPMVAYQRPSNLRDHLVRAKLPPVDRRRGAGTGPRLGFKWCGKTCCLCCLYSEESRTHTCSAIGMAWRIKECISCQDNNVVYSITCNHQAGSCQDAPQYIGKVGPICPCRERCTEHRGSVTNNQEV